MNFPRERASQRERERKTDREKERGRVRREAEQVRQCHRQWAPSHTPLTQLAAIIMSANPISIIDFRAKQFMDDLSPENKARPGECRQSASPPVRRAIATAAQQKGAVIKRNWPTDFAKRITAQSAPRPKN